MDINDLFYQMMAKRVALSNEIAGMTENCIKTIKEGRIKELDYWIGLLEEEARGSKLSKSKVEEA